MMEAIVLVIFTIAVGTGVYQNYLKWEPPVKEEKQMIYIGKEVPKGKIDKLHQEDNISGIQVECVSPVEVENTSYCENGITASGSKTRLGIAAAKKEWIGKIAILYENNQGKIGDMLGIWEIEDTGGDYRIKEGNCIDVWLPTEQEAIEWGRKKVYLQLIDGKG